MPWRKRGTRPRADRAVSAVSSPAAVPGPGALLVSLPGRGFAEVTALAAADLVPGSVAVSGFCPVWRGSGPAWKRLNQGTFSPGGLGSRRYRRFSRGGIVVRLAWATASPAGSAPGATGMTGADPAASASGQPHGLITETVWPTVAGASSWRGISGRHPPWRCFVRQSGAHCLCCCCSCDMKCHRTAACRLLGCLRLG